MALPSYSPFSGKLTKFLIGTSELTIETLDWSAKADVETLHPSTSNGFMRRVTNFVGATVKVGGAYHAAENYHADPPEITEGAVLTAVHCKPNGTLDYTGDFVVEDFHWVGGGKNGAVKFDATLLSDGTYTRPTGA